MQKTTLFNKKGPICNGEHLVSTFLLFLQDLQLKRNNLQYQAKWH